MENLNEQWLSDPWAQLALDDGMSKIAEDPKTMEIGRKGLQCIECIRQLAARPTRCGSPQ